MSVVRVIVVDPMPRDACNDLVVYQVPENGRAHKLLQELCDGAGLQHVTIEPTRKKKTAAPVEAKDLTKDPTGENK